MYCVAFHTWTHTKYHNFELGHFLKDSADTFWRYTGTWYYNKHWVHKHWRLGCLTKRTSEKSGIGYRHDIAQPPIILSQEVIGANIVQRNCMGGTDKNAEEAKYLWPSRYFGSSEDLHMSGLLFHYSIEISMTFHHSAFHILRTLCSDALFCIKKSLKLK